MLTIDPISLSIQIADFLFLILILNFIVFRPIRNIIKKRKEAMSSDEDMAQSWTQKAGNCSEELESNMSDTRKKGTQEKETLKSSGLEKEQEMFKEAYSMVEEKIKKAKAELEEKRLRAKETLHADVKGFSMDLAEKFLGRGL
jgi:F-type H+-transporting ATPase subunit b